VVAAALVAGVGVAGVTTATSGAASGLAAGKNRPAAALAAPAPSTQSGPASAPAASSGPSLSSPVGSPLASPAPSLSASAAQAGVGSVDALGTGTAGLAGTGTAANSVGTGSASAVGAGSVGAQGTGTAGAALSFVPQARKVKPLPLWVNPLPEATTTSCFGPRWGRLHAGVDLAAPDGTRIRAAGEGTVVAAGPAEGYGNAVLIDHGNGYLTHYGHMSAITVTPGQHVATGDQIGNEGSTGHSTGPHLHFEVHQGSYQNPIEPTAWMHEHGVDITGCAVR